LIALLTVGILTLPNYPNDREMLYDEYLEDPAPKRNQQTEQPLPSVIKTPIDSDTIEKPDDIKTENP
jgi:hypothetical protein